MTPRSWASTDRLSEATFLATCHTVMSSFTGVFPTVIAAVSSVTCRSFTAVTASETRTADELREPADQADSCGGSERREVVLVDAVLESRVTDLVQSEELIESVRPSVWHHQTVERHGQSRFADALNWFGLPQQPGAGWNEDVLPAVRIERIGDQTVHWRRSGAIQSVRQNGVHKRPFEDPMQWTRGTDRSGTFRCALLFDLRPARSRC